MLYEIVRGARTMARPLRSMGVQGVIVREVDLMSGGPEGLRAAGHALLYWQRRQEVNTHNLANSETAGYRARRVFAEMLDGGIPAVGTRVDERVGELRRTGAPLDLALAGEGSFVVQTPDGEKPVRSGSFSLDPDGRIVDASGNVLLGTTGPLVVPPGPVEIDARGGVSVDGEQVGRLRVVSDRASSAPMAGEEVLPGGRGVEPGAEAGGMARGNGRSGGSGGISDDLPDELITVRQGYLEESNVSALDALIEMTTIQRSFAAVQTSVRAIDSIMETVANRIGRVE